jgi:tetratricopeptide (TPR) repeat protein
MGQELKISREIVTSKQRWRGAGLVVVIALLLFGASIRFGFLEHDDDRNIYENPRMLAMTSETLSSYWQEPYLGLYIPATYLYWSAGTALSHALSSGEALPTIKPWIFHLGNVVLHAANGALVWMLLLEFGASVAAALIAALFFVAHPIQVEAVAWASGAKDVLSSFFGLASLLFYAKFLQPRSTVSPRSASASSRRAQQSQRILNLFYAISFVCFILAILAKPSQLVLPALYLLMSIYTNHKLTFRSLTQLIPHALAFCAYFSVANATQGAEGTFQPVPWLARPLIAGDAIIFYLQKIMIPIDFALDYGRHPKLVMGNVWLLIRSLVPYCGAALGIWIWFRRPMLGYRLPLIAALVFILGLLPSLGFLPFGYQFFSTVCDRYAYLAVLGPSILVCGLVNHVHSQRTGTLITSLVILALLATQTLRQVDFWSSERKLFDHSLAVQPDGAVALIGISNDLANQGNWAATLPLLERARNALPDWARPHNNLGTTYVNLNRLQDAADALAEAIRIRPLYPLALSNRCSVLTDLHRYSEAVTQCREAVSQAPEFAPAYLNLALALVRTNQWDAARASFIKALAINPTNFDARLYWALALKDHSDLKEAVVQLQILKQQYPSNAEAAQYLDSILSAEKSVATKTQLP